ncbi:hypothetical protein OYC64_018025 [Pagothenia borchgrevinki]|uniref:Uncharacterized protein n=1 Tax=Pagothenia borchgrevinki TaxID=8213 RepID=A0ABD2GNI1_PAGBO
MQAWDNTRCYRVVSITADHQSGGSAGHFRSRRGSQLAQRLQPAPRLQSQAPLRPCPRQGRETPGQTTETLPAADCLMLTAERIQAKGGGAHQELLCHRHFPEFHDVYFNHRTKHLLICRGVVMKCMS